jgi:hypothetical protein
MSQSDYIQLRQSGYYLRYTLPQKYKCFLNRSELRYFLCIRKLLEARRLARRLVEFVETLFDALTLKKGQVDTQGGNQLKVDVDMTALS